MHHTYPHLAHHLRQRSTAWAGMVTLAAALASPVVNAQAVKNVSSAQHAMAQQAAQAGVPVTELAANAPSTYTVQRGDTLWGIAGVYLQKPWHWPLLWGMNQSQFANPHLIYPGQVLYLHQQDGYARLGTQPEANDAEPAPIPTVRVSPRTREQSLAEVALPTLKPHLIEPFLVEPLVVDDRSVQQAPRIVATTEERVLMSTGDRAYVRSEGNGLQAEAGEPRQYRIFRNATPMKDPSTQAILGYEAQFLGKATLVRGESVEGGHYVPATVDITSVREEIRAGDRLLPAPTRTFASYMPHAPQADIEAQVVSIYGSSAMVNAAQNHVVAINRGSADGLESGHVLRLMTQGQRIQDKTDAARATIQLPNESNGMAMVFRIFERVSYALILDVRVPVRVGDRLLPPQ